MYTCGTFIQDAVFYDEDYKDVHENVYVKANLTCSSQIELPYYTAWSDPLCIYCGTEIRLDIQPYKYPICAPCISKKLLPIDKHVHGKSKKGVVSTENTEE